LKQTLKREGLDIYQWNRQYEERADMVPSDTRSYTAVIQAVKSFPTKEDAIAKTKGHNERMSGAGIRTS
jgi:hypothetical protein